jgi:hypothetical protein
MRISARSKPIPANTCRPMAACAYGVALGKKFDGDPRYWKIVDGKLYLNLNGDIQTANHQENR